MTFTLLAFLIRTAALGVVAQIALLLCRKCTAATRHVVAVTALCTTVLLATGPFATNLRFSTQIPIDLPTNPVQPPKGVTHYYNSDNSKIPAENAEAPQREPIEWLPLAWLAGTAFLTVRLVVGLLLLRRKMRACYPIPELGPNFLLDPTAPSPATVGWRKDYILLPPSWTLWSEPTLTSVIRHERAHVERRDWWVSTLVNVLCAVTWPNPFSWLLKRQIGTLCEQAVDDVVVQSGISPSQYAHDLLKVATQPSQGGLTLAMSARSPVSKRIEMILSQKRNRGSASIAAIVLASGAFASSAAALLSWNLVPKIEAGATSLLKPASLPAASPNYFKLAPLALGAHRYYRLTPYVQKEQPSLAMTLQGKLEHDLLIDRYKRQRKATQRIFQSNPSLNSPIPPMPANRSKNGQLIPPPLIGNKGAQKTPPVPANPMIPEVHLQTQPIASTQLDPTPKTDSVQTSLLTNPSPETPVAVIDASPVDVKPEVSITPSIEIAGYNPRTSIIKDSMAPFPEVAPTPPAFKALIPDRPLNHRFDFTFYYLDAKPDPLVEFQMRVHHQALDVFTGLEQKDLLSMLQNRHARLISTGTVHSTGDRPTLFAVSRQAEPGVRYSIQSWISIEPGLDPEGGNPKFISMTIGSTRREITPQSDPKLYSQLKRNADWGLHQIQRKVTRIAIRLKSTKVVNGVRGDFQFDDSFNFACDPSNLAKGTLYTLGPVVEGKQILVVTKYSA